MPIDAKLTGKLTILEKAYEGLRFARVMPIALELAETQEHLPAPPGESSGLKWRPAPAGERWGRNFSSAWFRGHVDVSGEPSDRPLFLRVDTGAPEALLVINGAMYGVLDANHPVRLLRPAGTGTGSFSVQVEAYAGHAHPGTQPFANLGLLNDGPASVPPEGRAVGRAEVVAEREDVSAFVFELRALHQLAEGLEPNSLRRGKILAALAEVQRIGIAKPEEAEEERWRAALGKARDVMRPLLAMRNGPTAPRMAIIGHSHIDTAWLWPIRETWRKLGRTFSSVDALMDQYPEFRFTQTAAYHADVVRRRYPDLFRRVQKRVREGRWEINGAMWIEPDCNIPSGESFARQLLLGQRATREMFGVTSDTLWQPDVFGYSAALPQILRQAGVEFFCTTKMAWNDTNRFPYDTFRWEGIDGTSVLSHLNKIHCWPDPKTLVEFWNDVQHKDVQDRRLVAFGYGDGGGGPMAEMIEMARLTRDLEGCPRAEYASISEFMVGARDELRDLPTWAGELYLELHRGTLTSVARLKRANRKCEFLLRDAELLATLAAIGGRTYPRERINEAWKALLLNQFHDILPGSSIAEVNDEATEAYSWLSGEGNAIARESATAILNSEDRSSVLIANSLSWERAGEVELEGLPPGRIPDGSDVVSQSYVDLDGETRVALKGVRIPALGYAVLPLRKAPAREAAERSPFVVDGNVVVTPFARVTFGEGGEITSFLDVAASRELVRAGAGINRLLLGEDVPAAWDNWDIDRDQERKLAPGAKLMDREVVSDGPLQLRLRSRYKLGRASTLTQDVVFHSGSAQVDFDTRVEWSERHQLLKAAFPIEVLARSARHEIQFGHLSRPTHDNTSWERAQFDVCAHKWTDVSEGEYGVAFLNDCKYGCTVKAGEYRLTLIKSGRHPDPRGDEGVHRFAYAVLPHMGDFSAGRVVRPAYEFNARPRAFAGGGEARSFGLASVSAANVIVEAVKLAEDRDAVVLRTYEAGGTGTHATIAFGRPVRAVAATNLLEEDDRPVHVSPDGAVSLYWRPFEIKTLVVEVNPSP